MSNADIEFIKLIHNLHQTARECVEAEVGDRTMTQAILLHYIGTHEDCSQTDLVNLTDVDRSTLADTIARMLKEGLIVRKRTKEDQRKYAIKLTAEGQRQFDELTGNIRRARAQIEARYPKLKQSALQPVIREAAE